ncbi:hypothetical protein ECC02_003790 [Trypanosoma cruzi]|uniref:LicD/FKTN/FKRP nucleotidyltransferase domain-containing protein n=1 Tax=Trypanosoma cruzi TaxID=5693 RepID=A0A7J6YAB8_TRYCR|nr:hypothetical protein ECC02_003790 [Trypanosoma cruzi]
MRRFSCAIFISHRYVSVFRPHIHLSPCVICDAAAGDSQETFGTSPSCDFPPPNFFPLPDVRNDCVVEQTSHGWSTTLERRREGLKKWLQKEHEWVGGHRMVNSAYLESCWEAFCNPARTLTKDEIAGTIDFLAQFCEVKLDDVPSETSASSNSMRQETEQPQCQNSVPGRVCHGKEEMSKNVFLTHVQRSMSALADIERQLLFQRTLLDFLCVTNSLSVPLFLCCGTALGAHREGYFIPHDNDIDVGVFYEDLQRLGGTMEEDAQSAVVSLLSHVALDGHFVLLDICGTVEKGLELRFLHHETRVALDLNVYYPPLAEDAALISQFGPFVWTASHYEDAGSRRHGMYRYRHASFREALVRLPFCDPAVASRADGFLVPPVSYLVEYFGEDWRTPRAYTYTEGLQNGEYKNIIEE